MIGGGMAVSSSGVLSLRRVADDALGDRLITLLLLALLGGVVGACYWLLQGLSGPW